MRSVIAILLFLETDDMKFLLFVHFGVRIVSLLLFGEFAFEKTDFFFKISLFVQNLCNQTE